MVIHHMVGISQSLHSTALDGGSPYDGDHPVRDITALDGE